MGFIGSETCMQVQEKEVNGHYWYRSLAIPVEVLTASMVILGG